ncbi:MAG: hypothetical protein H8E66_27380 [Planctomycetes bacterium]|nr:hypothetical protein [Planctomycetota bacterium]
MTTAKIFSLAALILGLFANAGAADEAGAGMAQTLAGAAQAEAMSWRTHAEYMRDDAEDKLYNAMGARAQLVAAGIDPMFLITGDILINSGNAHKASGTNKYAQGVFHDADGQLHMTVAGNAMTVQDWDFATTQYDAAIVDFDAAAEDYEAATTGGFYEAYVRYDAALMEFDEFLMLLMM